MQFVQTEKSSSNTLLYTLRQHTYIYRTRILKMLEEEERKKKREESGPEGPVEF